MGLVVVARCIGKALGRCLGPCWATLLLSFSLVSTASGAETFLVIIAGLGGEETYRERFHEWSTTMRQAAIDKAGLAPEQIFYLAEDPALDPVAVHAKSTKENIAKLFEDLRGKVRPGDQLYVLLIGHGSYLSEQSRFNLPGRDLASTDFADLLKPFSEQRIVFVNASSASGGFLADLSGPNRVVVTATKSGFERNESKFGGYFVEAYASDGADVDKNERVSVLEAFNYAQLNVTKVYEEAKTLRTEHAVFDDNGDGEGVSELSETDGDVAGVVYLTANAAGGGGISAERLASDPELAALFEQKLDLEGRVEALKLQKDSMPEELYMKELESLLVELAVLSGKIQAKQDETTPECL